MTAAPRGGVRELRCECGSLAARVVDGRIELKCRRCQRIGLLELASVLQGGVVEVTWQGEARRPKAKEER